MSQRGVPMYKQADPDWYYWLGDKAEGYANGNVSARTLTGAKREIRYLHPGDRIACVMHQQEYFGCVLGL